MTCIIDILDVANIIGDKDANIESWLTSNTLYQTRHREDTLFEDSLNTEAEHSCEVSESH